MRDCGLPEWDCISSKCREHDAVSFPSTEGYTPYPNKMDILNQDEGYLFLFRHVEMALTCTILKVCVCNFIALHC